MNKTSILLASLLLIGATACEEDPSKGIPQTNEQLPVMSIDGVTAQYDGGETLTLEGKQGENIQLISLTSAENLPEGATVNFELEMSADENFAQSKNLKLNNGSVAVNDLDKAYKALMGNSPEVHKMYLRFPAYIADGNNSYRVGGLDKYFGNMEVTVVPIDLKLPIEKAYYLVVNGTKLAMEHSAAHVYDDPNFSLKVKVSEEAAAAGYMWTVESASGKLFGVEEAGDTSTSGFLEENGAAAQIAEAGSWLITVNMLDGSYSVEPKNNMWVPGNGNGWNFENSQMLFQFNGKFVGFAYIDGEFKFTDADNWNGVNYGAGDAEGELSTAGGNLSAAAGLYWCEVDLSGETPTYSLTPIQTVGLIGDFNGWGGDVEMTPSENYLVWTGTLTVADGEGWKFRMNKDWAINLGGSMVDLQPNGGNITLAGAGTYTVKLDLRKLPYTCTAE